MKNYHLGRAVKAVTTGIFCFLFSSMSFAQTPAASPNSYLEMAYIKVAPNMDADYIKLEKAFKKIHTARKKAGKMYDWTLWAVVSPSGSNAEYNYVTHNRYLGDDQFANAVEGEYMPENWQSLLTPEELALVNRTSEIRTIVKTEVWSLTESIMPEGWSKKGKIAVFNYMANGAGKTRADHIKMEKDIWMPVHNARVKDGKMTAWWLMNLENPFGSSMPYNSVTVDLYPNMKAYLANWFDEYFKKVHPTKDVNDLMKQTNAATNLVKGEVRMVIDRLSW